MLLLGIQSTVPRRDLDLHSSAPSLTFLPTSPSASDGDSKNLTPFRVLGQDYTEAKIIQALFFRACWFPRRSPTHGGHYRRNGLLRNVENPGCQAERIMT